MQYLPLIRDMDAHQLAADEARIIAEVASLERNIEVSVMFNGDHAKLELYESYVEFQLWLLERGQAATLKLKAGHDQAAAYLNGCECHYCNASKFNG